MNTNATSAPSMTDLFGEVISSYSRAQGLEDGVLVDVTETAAEAGFRWPVAMTRAAFDLCVTVPPKVWAQDEAGRLWDVVFMAHNAIRRSRAGGTRLLFQLHVRNTNRHGTPPLVTLALVTGPGDNAEPVVTIMLPEED
jgi:hypothetical protein